MVQKINCSTLKPKTKRVKKIVQKRRKNNETNKIESRFSERTGSNSSCFTMISEPEYLDNEEGDCLENNCGIQVRPLDKRIYGE